MTFWWSNENYGQLLQCYALQKYLRDLGHDVFLIRYLRNNDIKSSTFTEKIIKAFNPIKLLSFIRKKIKAKKNATIRTQDRFFDNFRQTYIKHTEIIYHSLSELKSNPPIADAYIVGSDQVWNYSGNFDKIKNIIGAYMLDFGDTNTKRLAYAASWSMHTLSKELKDEISPLLQKFDYISVREKNGIELCKFCGRDDAEWVCDPTFLLSAEIYRTLYNENLVRKISSKYILLYMLGNECDFDYNAILKFSKKLGLQIVYVQGSFAEKKANQYDATIPEWLYLIDNAEYVITNSFHCGVFSIIFHKQFGIIPLKGSYVGMNTRFDSMFESLNINSRYLKNDFTILNLPYTPSKPLFGNINNLITFLREN